MGISILDPHPSNECIELGARDAWFSFIFCGNHVDAVKLHLYDYYSGDEILTDKVIYQEVPALETNINTIWKNVGNGVRINIKDFVKDTSIFKNEGEYTWRAELIHDVKLGNNSSFNSKENVIYPDNMVYEGVLPGEPGFYTFVGNVKGIDTDHYIPFINNYRNKIKPPYYIDFLDKKYENEVIDVPVTYDEVKIDKNGNQYSVVQVDTYSSTSTNVDAIPRPSPASRAYIHKKKAYGQRMDNISLGANDVFIDNNIPSINANDRDKTVMDGCYLKVGSDYFPITAYDRESGIITCQNGNKLKDYPAGTRYSIYTSRFWTPYYYFRVHKAPKVNVSAEFNERRRLAKKEYDMETNCIENTANGILFKAAIDSDSHSPVKYHYWEIFDSDTGKMIYKTEKTYSREMECEVFVPFGYKKKEYTGKITVVTQDNITVRAETSYTVPRAPDENNERFSLKAIQNKFGGVELAWNYNYNYDGGSFQRATDFEVFRIDKRLQSYGGKDYLKYLGKVDCSPFSIDP